MRTLKGLTVSLCLITILAVTALAGETEGPPCAHPGETQTPPCASAQLTADDLTGPGQLETPPASNTFDITSTVEEALITFLLF